MSGRVRVKGKFMKAKTVVNNLRRNAILAEGRKIKKAKYSVAKSKDSVCKGRRIVDIQELAKNLKCCLCKETLALENIESERLNGLHAIWEVKCEKCLVRTQVHSGKKHQTRNNENFSDLNTRAVLGVLHSGSGCTALNKLLSCLSIPTMSDHVFKKYEEEIGPILEEAAKEICKRAAVEERRATIDRMEELCLELPPEILDELYPELQTLYSSISPEDEENPLDLEHLKNFDAAVGNIINIIVSYDMGWSKRGNGKSYDSLNGYGTIIGYLSKKILDFGTRNRKCKTCDNGHSPDDHKCRKNFEGSAKAMEPHLGAELVNKSEVLKSAGVSVRAIVGDDDSSTISAILHGSVHKIFKLSCKIHLGRNFVKGLYNLKKDKRYSELGKKGVIPHLKKYFFYALAQNAGDTEKMKVALLSIRDHVYGQHENCGDWCHRDEGKKGTIVLQNQDLHSALYEYIAKYANNASKFSAAANTQSNENFNATLSPRMPKARSYSPTAAADYRVAGAVLNINEGNNYVSIVEEKLHLSPGVHTAAFSEKLDKKRKERSAKIKLKKTKGRRIVLKKQRESLKNKNEKKEGVQYKRNCGIDMNDTDGTHGQIPDVIDIESLDFSRPSESCKIVFFDLETSGFEKTADILHIAAQCEGRAFSTYINPTQEINQKASDVTGLRNIDGELFFHNQKVDSIPLKDALLAFCQFLTGNKSKSCLLVAHNATFDASHLFRALQKCSLLGNVCFVAGYVDTLSILRKKFPKRKGEGVFKLATLAKDLLNIHSDENFHEALYDVEILEKITNLEIPKEDLLANVQCFFEPLISPTLAPLKAAVSTMIVKKIAKEGMTYGMLKRKYSENGKEAIEKLFTENIGGKKPRITKSKKIISKIIEVLRSTSQSNE